MERVYENIEDMLCKELEEIGRKGEVTSNNLDVMYKSLDIIKDIHTVDAMKKGGYSNTYSGDYSERYMHPMYSTSNMENSYDNRGRGRYAERDSMGRYSSDGYSRSSADEIRNLMSRTQNEQDKEILRKALESMR